jgi:uncharacterized protein (DUF934 family)
MQFITSANDLWHRVGGEDGPDPHPSPKPHCLLSLAQWHAVRDTWPADLPTGVRLANTDEVEDLAADLQRLSLIVLQFPKWVDGRAYSQARVLRARLRFTGQIRAVGDVLVDMLPLLARTGVDAVQMRHDQSETVGRRTLAQVSDFYQGDVLQHRPHFARSLA